MLRKYLTVAAGFLAVALCSAVIASDALAAAPLSRHISYRFTLRNTSGSAIPRAELWTYAPYPLTAVQERTGLSTSHPFELLTDETGNQIIHVTFSDFPPYGTKIVALDADLLLIEHPQLNNPTIVIPAIDYPTIQQFLKPERYCESGDPEIVRLAQELRAETPLETAKNIFDWIAANIRYSGYLKDARGAAYALERRQGDCTEFMYLFMALCRAAGIPARGIGGYVIEKNAVLTPSAYHNWAEFYADGAWRLADPQRKIFMQNQSHYLVMRVLGPASDEHPMRHYRRFRYSGEGLEVSMN
jgi:transglutaminase-like putative cysteine protease